MSPVTHFFTGWTLANVLPLGRWDRALVTWSAVVPDVDGLGIVAEMATRHSSHPLLWFSRYHHSLHNLAFAAIVAGLGFALAEKKWITTAGCLLGFHLHLLEDLLGSRGPDGDQWPIPYLAPFSHALQWTWHGQWNLNAWPNFAITLALLGGGPVLGVAPWLLAGGDVFPKAGPGACDGFAASFSRQTQNDRRLIF